jgi:hypothetical protein
MLPSDQHALRERHTGESPLYPLCFLAQDVTSALRVGGWL